MLHEVVVPAGGGLIQVDVEPVFQQHASREIAFRISFAGTSSAGPDAVVVIAMATSMSDPVPMLTVDGGLVGH